MAPRPSSASSPATSCRLAHGPGPTEHVSTPDEPRWALFRAPGTHPGSEHPRLAAGSAIPIEVAFSAQLPA